MNRSWPRSAVCGLLAAGSLVAAGCSGTESQSPIQFENPPVWTHEDLDLDLVAGAAFRGDAVVVAGERDDAWRLVVADAKTGTPLWSIEQDQVLPGGDDRVLSGESPSPIADATGSPVIAGEGDDWTVIVGYDEVDANGTAKRRGIAALSGEDGSPAWTRKLATVDKKELAEVAVLPAAADEKTVVAGTEHPTRTFALDAATGEKRWEHEDKRPFAVSGDVVTGQTVYTDDSGVETGNSAYGWNADSGKELWKEEPTGHEFSLRLATKTAVVVGDEDGNRILDTGSGRTIGDNGGWDGDCAVDATTTTRFACSNERGSMITVVTVKDGEVSVTQNEITVGRQQFDVIGMCDGRIFVDTPDGNKTHKGRYLIDDQAEILAKDVPGRPAVMSQRYAFFLSGEQDSQGYSKAGLYKVAKS